MGSYTFWDWFCLSLGVVITFINLTSELRLANEEKDSINSDLLKIQTEVEDLKKLNQANFFALQSTVAKDNNDSLLALKLALAAYLIEPESSKTIYKTLVSASYNIRSHDTIWPHSQHLRSVTISPTSDLILIAGSDNTAKLWDMNGNDLVSFVGHSNHLSSAVFNPSGDLILTASEDTTAKLWDLDGNLLITFEGHKGKVKSVAFNSTGNRIITTSSDATAKLWDLDGNLLFTLVGNWESAKFADFDLNGDLILTTSIDGTTKLWDLDGIQVALLDTSQIRYLVPTTFNPTSNLILSISDPASLYPGSTHQIILWDQYGVYQSKIVNGDIFITSATFNPIGDRVLITDEAGVVNLWDLDGNLKSSFQGHEGAIRSATFNSTGDRILTAGVDTTVKLWDLDGNLLDSFMGHSKSVWLATFNPAGNLIITASADNTIKIWHLNEYNSVYFARGEVLDEMTIAQNTITSGFNEAECEQYFKNDLENCPKTREALLSFGQ